ncbi:MAG: glycosyltransferase [Anaerolineae bacterium]|nr:glycosyltransferase [Anaerolineae bacterium]NIN95313.1 glycosyltransferase [Anaerolineae bacterium]NIQ78278.1 glycosyltransferase [Anaerolineae bacterium]
MSSVSIVIPAYNEEQGIESILVQLEAVTNRQDVEYEIIVVDDGSTDRTADLVRQHQGVRLVRHHTNRGYGAAIKTGIRQADHEWIAIIDADGTYPAAAIPSLVAETDRYDMIVGARSERDFPLIRRPAKWFIAKLAEYLSETNIPDLNSGLRVFRKDIALSYFNILPSRFSFTITITIAFLSDHYLVKFIPIPYQKRHGKSKVSPIQDTLNFVQLILRTIMYFRPLKVLLPISCALFLLAVIIGIYSLLTQGRVMDITVIVLTMAAIQITVVAMIADMIQKKNKV